MAQYRLHFIDHGDNIFGSETLQAADDAHAIEHARARHRTGIGKGYEIWRDERLVHTELRGQDTAGS